MGLSTLLTSLKANGRIPFEPPAVVFADAGWRACASRWAPASALTYRWVHARPGACARGCGLMQAYAHAQARAQTHRDAPRHTANDDGMRATITHTMHVHAFMSASAHTCIHEHMHNPTQMHVISRTQAQQLCTFPYTPPCMRAPARTHTRTLTHTHPHTHTHTLKANKPLPPHLHSRL